MAVIRLKCSTIKHSLGILLLTIMIVWVASLVTNDIMQFDCCRAWQFYVQPEHDAGKYAHCLELDNVKSGDGKDCFVWFIFKYFLFGPLYFGPILFVFSAFFLKGFSQKAVVIGSILAMVPSITLLIVFLVEGNR